MKRIVKSILVCSLLAGGFIGVPSLFAADAAAKTQEKASAGKRQAKRDWYPFGGIVAAVDTQAKTISLKKKSGERVLKLDSRSTLQIDGKPGGIGNVRVGDYAHGKLHKDAAGKEVITDARFEKEKPAKSKEPRAAPGSKSKPQ